MDKTIRFKLNGKEVAVETSPERMLLWVLRTDLEHTGTKYGCGEGYCGFCTVIVDGQPERSCRLPLAKVEGKSVVTIEGLSKGSLLHPLQQAFVDNGALQCGYCTPGMIMEAYALLLRKPNPTEAEIADALEGNLCRCGTHKRVIAAVRQASGALKMKVVDHEAR
ncbi:MAG: (2Fe-2S)-binding protein [Candidatus Aminicenantes bacterium]|nr:MAG: (2Fe-2S)-binding protein [Candidatus Aminicenantes bacterium]RPJ03417.1 MAG: (2Fe-2S)-binding protein [Candidatus Aminicenantes bacterium]